MASYVIRILIAVDQVVTTIVGGFPDETLSSYAYRLDQQGKRGGQIFRPLIDTLFFWEKDHCKGAWEDERERNQFPPELRGPFTPG